LVRPTKHRFLPFLPIGMLLIFLLYGCAGIRFVQVAPEAQDFHPRSVAILALDMGGHEEAREVLDRIVTAELTAKKWFDPVVSAEALQSLLRKNEDLRKSVADYLGKLKAVNFSDSDLSRKIGKLAKVDAFLLVNVDYWYYTKEADKNVAKVGLGMKMINAETGVMVWKGGHDLAPEYMFLKPELASVARDVVKPMVRQLPH